jgi:hypothetical protein
MTRLRIPKLRLESFTVIQRQGEVHKEDSMVEGIIFLEEEKEVEEER